MAAKQIEYGEDARKRVLEGVAPDPQGWHPQGRPGSD